VARPVAEEFRGDSIGERFPDLPVHPGQELLIEQKPHFFPNPDLPPWQGFIPLVPGPELVNEGDADETAESFRLNPDGRGLHPAQTDTEPFVVLPFDRPTKRLDKGIGGEVDACAEVNFLCEMHEMKPYQFVVLAQLLSAVDNLPVPDNGNFRILHEHSRLLSIAAVEEGGAQDLIRHRPLTIRPLGKEFGLRREGRKDLLEGVRYAGCRCIEKQGMGILSAFVMQQRPPRRALASSPPATNQFLHGANVWHRS